MSKKDRDSQVVQPEANEVEQQAGGEVVPQDATEPNVVFQGKAGGIPQAERYIANCPTDVEVELPRVTLNTVVNNTADGLGCYVNQDIPAATVPLKWVSEKLARLVSYDIKIGGKAGAQLGEAVQAQDWLSYLTPTAKSGSKGPRLPKQVRDLAGKILQQNGHEWSTANTELRDKAVAAAEDYLAKMEVPIIEL